MPSHTSNLHALDCRTTKRLTIGPLTDRGIGTSLHASDSHIITLSKSAFLFVPSVTVGDPKRRLLF